MQSFLVEQPAEHAQLRRRSTSPGSSRGFEFDNTRASLVGPPGDHAAIWRRVTDDAAVLLAAELIGVSEAADALALDYAQVREVFGKPLSKFQVTRHKAVDMMREIEIARVAVHYAAWASEVDSPEREIAAAMAKAQAATAANYVTAECIQIHGGVGYTWENDSHVFLRRAKVDDLLLGAQGWQLERVADEYFASSMTAGGMKAAVYYETGAPDVLRYEDVPDPSAARGASLIDVEAISIEGGDTLNRSRGDMPSVPHIVGYQCAGTISEVGEGVTDRNVGDRVVATMFWGSHAEKVAVPPLLTWPIPAGGDIVKSACVPVACGTARRLPLRVRQPRGRRNRVDPSRRRWRGHRRDPARAPRRCAVTKTSTANSSRAPPAA